MGIVIRPLPVNQRSKNSLFKRRLPELPSNLHVIESASESKEEDGSSSEMMIVQRNRMEQIASESNEESKIEVVPSGS